MTAATPLRLAPKHRFPEFRDAGEWELTQIGNIASITKGKGVSKADISKSGLTPCISNGELYTHYGEIIREVFSRTNLTPEDLVLSQAEDVIIPASAETRAGIARAACVVPAGVALGGDINIIRSDLSGRFLSYLLNSPIRNTIARFSQGDTAAHLYPVQLSKVTISYPLPAEQQKIADCLGSLDDLIAANGRKLEVLRQHKQYLMQQMFPKKGETVPRLRFPEFRDAGKWERTQIGNIASVAKGRGVSKADISKSGLTPCINYGELYTHYGEIIREVSSRTNLTPEDLVLSQTEDVIIHASGESRAGIARAACVVPAGVAIGGGINIIRSDLSGRFLSHLLNSPIRNTIARLSYGDTVAQLYPARLSKVMISYPLPAEQQRIADCLGSLDDLIAAQVRKLEVLRQQKQGLMQQLFPSLEGDES